MEPLERRRVVVNDGGWLAGDLDLFGAQIRNDVFMYKYVLIGLHAVSCGAM